MKRKIISVLIAAVMLLPLTPCVYSADSGTAGTITWSITDDTLTVSGTGTVPSVFSIYNLSSEQRASVKNLIVNDGIEGIGTSAFYTLSALTSATLAPSVKTIGNNAFYDARKLSEVEMSGVTKIGDNAFYRTSLKKATAPLPECLETIGEDAFAETLYGEFNIGANVSSIGTNALNSAEKITVDSENQYYSSENGILFNKDKTELICYPAYLKLKDWDGETEYIKDDYEIPPTVKMLAPCAMEHTEYLEILTLSKLLEKIGERAIGNYYISDIDTGENTNFVMKDGVLYDAEKTTAYVGLVQKTPEKVMVESGVTTIEPYAFAMCPVTELVLPESVKTIGSNAFFDCDRLITVTMSSEIKTIGAYAFLCGDGDIEKVNFIGSRDAWNRLCATAGMGNNNLLEADVEYSNPDGEEQPEFYRLKYNTEERKWQISFYAGTIKKDCIAVVALLDADTGELLRIKQTTLTPDSVMEDVFIGGSKNLRLKAVVYCWDSLSGMTPVWDTPLVSE